VAAKESWIIVSKDEDFLHIAKTIPKVAQLIWVRIGNCRSAALLSVFNRLFSTIEAALLAKEDIIEIR
jgi:predicted nuclease of predicted toxin-antitoxin system